MLDKIKIQVAGWDDGYHLHRVVFDCYKRSGFKIEDLVAEDNIDKVLNLMLAVDCDPAIYDAIWACLARCTYNGEKITKATFEPAENREYFIPIAGLCIKENIMPFIEGLRSALFGMLEQIRSPQNGNQK